MTSPHIINTTPLTHVTFQFIDVTVIRGGGS